MNYHKRTLVTIICESILEEKIVEIAKQFGVIGYTVLEARGEGAQGIRGGDFEYDKNIKLELLCKHETADHISEEIKKQYFENYAMVIYHNDVDVLRPDKFK